MVAAKRQIGKFVKENNRTGKFHQNCKQTKPCPLWYGHHGMSLPLFPPAKQLLILLALTSVFSSAVFAKDLPKWTFDTAGNFQGWKPIQHMINGTVTGGALAAVTTSNDPFFIGPDINVPAEEASTVVVRMKLQFAGGEPVGKAGDAQLFWITDTSPDFCAAASVKLKTTGDAEWHEYEFPVSENRNWKDTITRLRLDPCNALDVEVAIDSIRLQK